MDTFGDMSRLRPGVPQSFVARFGTACATIILLLFSTSGLYVPTALASGTCGNGTSGHCYAGPNWKSTTQSTGARYNGVYMSEDIEHQSCTGSCYFTSKEVWLQQYDGNCSSQICWIEAGYLTGIGAGTYYFWGHEKPNNGGFIGYNLGQVPSGDYYNDANIEILRESPGVWGVIINSPNFNEYFNSISQPYSPNQIIEGEELADSGINGSGASSDWAGIYDSEAELNNPTTWYYENESRDGVYNDNPPNEDTVLAAAPGNNGGIYATSCCTVSGSAVVASRVPSGPHSAGTPSLPSASAPTPPVPTTATVPEGTPAIPVNTQTDGAPAFTTAAATAYVESHPLPQMSGSTEPQVTNASFVTDEALKSIVGDDAQLGANALLCYVPIRATITVESPGGGVVTYQQGFEAFSAQTGNLIMWGGEP